MYNNMPKEQNNFKGIVLEFLDYLRYKVENDNDNPFGESKVWGYLNSK